MEPAFDQQRGGGMVDSKHETLEPQFFHETGVSAMRRCGRVETGTGANDVPAVRDAMLPRRHLRGPESMMRVKRSVLAALACATVATAVVLARPAPDENRIARRSLAILVTQAQGMNSSVLADALE